MIRSLSAITWLALVTASTPAIAADASLFDFARWYRPSASDFEEDSFWDEMGEEEALPEAAAMSALSADSDSRVEGEWTPKVSRPYWVVPSKALPSESAPMASNNNVGIVLHEGRLYMSWRSAPIHFAHRGAKLFILSSADFGRTWEYDGEIALGSDVREPNFVSLNGRLILTFFQAGKKATAFEPKKLFLIERIGPRQWSELRTWGNDGEIAWEMKVRDGRAWTTTYEGNHYAIGGATMQVHFKVSDDGINWKHVNESKPDLYKGGVSEVGWEFDSRGNFWAVTRNEDGDRTGFGSHLVFAPASDLSAWQVPKKSDPWRYDSPKMFRHGEEIYLVARRDVGGPFDRGWRRVPFNIKRWIYLARYSLRPKRTALYKIDRERRKVVWLQDLPGTGDTAFPSIVQTGPHSFLVANYTSPLRYPKRSWIWGQLSPQGTQVYFVNIDFARKR